MKQLHEELARPKELEIIILDEYRILQELAAFRCPIKLDPRTCNGKPCPTRPYTYIDYFDECIEARRARLRLDRVLRGESVIFRDPNKGFEVPLP